MICNFLIWAYKINLVIVFGMSRSGTTFMGKSLALDESNSLYIHEPVKILLKEKYDSMSGEKSGFWPFVFHEDRKKLKLHYLVCVVLKSIVTGKVPKGGTLCVKPITMIDSLQEVSDALSCSVVYISRHPCGYADSMKRQVPVIEGQDRARAFDLDALRDVSSGWGSRNKSIKQLFARNEKWVWAIFEDVCIESDAKVKDLYLRLGMEWTQIAEEKLLSMTNTRSDSFYGTNRKSSEEVDKWKNTLSEDEIEAIRSETLKYNTSIYEGF